MIDQVATKQNRPLGHVMPGLVPGIHVGLRAPHDVDGRDKPGHDEERDAPVHAQRLSRSRAFYRD